MQNSSQKKHKQIDSRAACPSLFRQIQPSNSTSGQDAIRASIIKRSFLDGAIISKDESHSLHQAYLKALPFFAGVQNGSGYLSGGGKVLITARHIAASITPVDGNVDPHNTSAFRVVRPDQGHQVKNVVSKDDALFGLVFAKGDASSGKRNIQVGNDYVVGYNFKFSSKFKSRKELLRSAVTILRNSSRAALPGEAVFLMGVPETRHGSVMRKYLDSPLTVSSGLVLSNSNALERLSVTRGASEFQPKAEFLANFIGLEGMSVGPVFAHSDGKLLGIVARTSGGGSTNIIKFLTDGNASEIEKFSDVMYSRIVRIDSIINDMEKDLYRR